MKAQGKKKAYWDSVGELSLGATPSLMHIHKVFLNCMPKQSIHSVRHRFTFGGRQSVREQTNMCTALDGQWSKILEQIGEKFHRKNKAYLVFPLTSVSD